jgi:hypothetical protein
MQDKFLHSDVLTQSNLTTCNHSVCQPSHPWSSRPCNCLILRILCILCPCPTIVHGYRKSRGRISCMLEPHAPSLSLLAPRNFRWLTSHTSWRHPHYFAKSTVPKFLSMLRSLDEFVRILLFYMLIVGGGFPSFHDLSTPAFAPRISSSRNSP